MDERGQPHSAILLVSCPDQSGLVATVTRFIHENNGNIINLEQYVDPEEKVFFMRLEWDLTHFSIPLHAFGETFQRSIAAGFAMEWSLHAANERPRMAIFVSTLSHCLYDILSHAHAGDWNVDIPLIVSNHPTLEPVAKKFGIDYRVFPMTTETKRSQEEKELALLQEYQIDFVVLARYMQILTAEFVDHYPNRVINIHHSFLPAFAGAKPYHSAHDRGVKIIGATSHYVTAELDTGPIIEQDIVRVSHADSIDDLIRKGRDLEKVVLSRAIWQHLRRNILVFRNRTIVFA